MARAKRRAGVFVPVRYGITQCSPTQGLSSVLGTGGIGCGAVPPNCPQLLARLLSAPHTLKAAGLVLDRKPSGEDASYAGQVHSTSPALRGRQSSSHQGRLSP